MEKFMRVEVIKEYMAKNNLSKTVFCKKCGISLFVLNKILKQKLNVRSRSLIKIVTLLGITSDYFLMLDGL